MWPSRIEPLVFNSTTESGVSLLYNRLSRTRIVGSWDSYVEDLNTRRDEQGRFLVVEELKSFLQSYKNTINVPNHLTGFRIFFSFFVEISRKNSTQINELHLSKVIALLQFHANVNLPASDNAPQINLLENIFSTPKLGCDVLNLLFSYGLSYDKFSQYLQKFISSVLSKNDEGSDSVNSSENLLQETSEKKRNFANKYHIDASILDLTDDNRYMQVYKNLANAYAAYQVENYVGAAALYKETLLLLTEINNQNSLSPVIRADYQQRYERSKEYYAICNELAEKKTAQLSKAPLGSRYCHYKNEAGRSKYYREIAGSDQSQAYEPLLKGPCSPP